MIEFAFQIWWQPAPNTDEPNLRGIFKSDLLLMGKQRGSMQKTNRLQAEGCPGGFRNINNIWVVGQSNKSGIADNYTKRENTSQ